MAERRVYPTSCTSMFCGRTECEGCPMKPGLDAFKAWRDRTAATQPDPGFAPRIWVATKEDPCQTR